MRQFWIEIGKRDPSGYVRLHAWKFDATSAAEAIEVAKLIADNAEGRHEATMALLLDDHSAVVRAWRLECSN